MKKQPIIYSADVGGHILFAALPFVDGGSRANSCRVVFVDDAGAFRVDPTSSTDGDGHCRRVRDPIAYLLGEDAP